MRVVRYNDDDGDGGCVAVVVAAECEKCVFFLF